MKKLLFLGYLKKETTIINFLEERGYDVKQLGQKKITKKLLKENFEYIISFGYKKIIKKDLLKTLDRPIINLHISYLPYNKGSHPNFWSFIENSPKGVSIHEIDEGIDTGKLIARKKIAFKDLRKQTFYSTYKILIDEAENFFKINFYKIKSRKYKRIYIKKRGTYHVKKQLPKSLKSWKINIHDFLQLYFK